MKVFIFALFFTMAMVAMAQAPSPVAASPAPVISAPVPASSSLFSPAVIGAVVSIVVCLNIALSAVQQIFAKLGKSEPGLLQDVSNVVLKIAKYLGSNPSV